MSSSYCVPTSAEMLRARLFLRKMERLNISSKVTVPVSRFMGWDGMDQLSFVSMGLEWTIRYCCYTGHSREIYEKFFRVCRLVDCLAAAEIEWNDARVAPILREIRTNMGMERSNIGVIMRLHFAISRLKRLVTEVTNAKKV